MNTDFLNSVTNFVRKRTFELIGLLLIFTSIALAVSFFTYTPDDPSFIYGDSDIEVKNFLGIYGSSAADFLLQSFGLASFLLLANFLFWGINLIIKKEIRSLILKLFFVVSYLTLGSIFIYLTFNNSFWLIDNGNSGFVGEICFNFVNDLYPQINNEYTLFILFFLTIVSFAFSSDINFKNIFTNIIIGIPKLFRKNANSLPEKNYRDDR